MREHGYTTEELQAMRERIDSELERRESDDPEPDRQPLQRRLNAMTDGEFMRYTRRVHYGVEDTPDDR